MQIPQTSPKTTYFVATQNSQAMVAEKSSSNALEFIDVTAKEDSQITSKIQGIIKVNQKGQSWVMRYAEPYFR